MTEMKTIKTLLVMMAVSLGLTAQAEVYEHLVLTNGSVLEGYIVGQIPGQCIKFYTEAIKSGQSGKLVITNDAMIPMDGVAVNDSPFDDITQLEAMPLPQTFSIGMTDIIRIERELRPEGQTYGLVDVVTTRLGQTIKGQITIQDIGKSIQVFTGASTRIVPNHELACQEKEAVDSNMSLFEQSPFIDVVVTHRNTYTGIITMQNYGSETHGSFVKIQEHDGVVSRVSVNDIQEIRRFPNEQYRSGMISATVDTPQELPIPGIAYFNQVPVDQIITDKDRSGNYIMDSDDVKHAPQLHIGNNKLVIEMDDTPDNQNSVLLRIMQKKVNGQYMFTFDDDDIEDNAISPTKKTTEGTKLRLEFKIVKAGTYGLYHRYTGAVNFCEIK